MKLISMRSEVILKQPIGQKRRPAAAEPSPNAEIPGFYYRFFPLIDIQPPKKRSRLHDIEYLVLSFCMRNVLFLIALFLTGMGELSAQDERTIRIQVRLSGQTAMADVTVALLKKDSSLFRTAITPPDGKVAFVVPHGHDYLVQVSRVGFVTRVQPIPSPEQDEEHFIVQLDTAATLLTGVTVRAPIRPFVQVLPDKTIVNVEAGVTNAGATVLEVLERSPGVTIDRNGQISLKGRPQVLILIDGKQTQLAGADLQNLLAGMNASQIAEIELMDMPPARYDAAGNAGIINIKTKKNRQKGFNGSLNAGIAQGRYPKYNKSLLLNYYRGKLNTFLNYSFNTAEYITDLYALRTYYRPDGSVSSYLEQPYFTKGFGNTHTIRTGIDYNIDTRTTIGVTLTGTALKRDARGRATAFWMNDMYQADSTIVTESHNTHRLKQGGASASFRHVFSASRELTADVEWVGYSIRGRQNFENRKIIPAGNIDASTGDIPSSIGIFSARTDYKQSTLHWVWETGLKTSRVNTDNEASYLMLQGGNWVPDFGKSNHFLYRENIHAAYSSLAYTKNKWNVQGGLRYEYTTYRAKQLGNQVNPDSTFDRTYHSLFPTVFVSYQADSLHQFNISGGRRIDRPVFQKLNPFVFIINKYTYQQGNPFLLPQYTWNIDVSHTYRGMLTTGVNYSFSNDYFSQIFLTDPATGTISYTDGNIGRMQNLGVSVGLQLSPLRWWSLSTQADYNHKRIAGYVGTDYYARSINQLSISMNNQLQFADGWTGELSGFYITRNQTDLQEVLNPTGQMSAGIARQLWGKRAVVRLTARDIFYTQIMAGQSYFSRSEEYFKLKRDTRVFTLSFTWRFGQSVQSQRQSSGAASDEINRVGSGN